MENLFEYKSNEYGNYFKTDGIVIQWIKVTLSPSQASTGAVILRLPTPVKYGYYSTSITRQYNKHSLSEGYYSCVPVSNEEIGVRLDGFKNNLEHSDNYYITVIGTPVKF